MKKALVLGAGGFIGGHMVQRLKQEGYWVRGVDLKQHEFVELPADEFKIADLRDPNVCSEVVDADIDEIYQFAADMGGAGYIFDGENDANVMHNSATINLNICKEAVKKNIPDVLYTSSACIYPEYRQSEADVTPAEAALSEDDAYPAEPDSEYGWEKLFSERLFLSFQRNHNINVSIPRLHNVFGPNGTWRGGREKAPAALCRKVAKAEDGGSIEVWGDGKQGRSFLYIDECIEGLRRLVESDFSGPVNLGSSEMVTINEYVEMVADIAGKQISLNHVEGPEGVRSRNSDNTLLEDKLGWKPTQPLREGVKMLYDWIENQLEHHRADKDDVISRRLSLEENT
jgi:nucleoside-diphosphate-sugar epimerase